MAKENLEEIGMNSICVDEEESYKKEVDDYVHDYYFLSDWYSFIMYLLVLGSCPLKLKKSCRISLKLKAIIYHTIYRDIHWRDHEVLSLRCMLEEEVETVMKEMHQGICGRHFVAREISHKLLRLGYFWPILFFNMHKLVRTYVPCQTFSRKKNLSTLPFNHVQFQSPFE